MSLSGCGRRAFACAGAFTHNSNVTSAHAHAHFCGVCSRMIGAAWPAPHAAAYQRSPDPSTLAKDTISLGNHVPAFNIVKVGPVGFPRFDVLWLELRSQLANLSIGKRHYFVLTTSTGFGLLSWVPGISVPRLSSPKIVWR